MINVCIISDTIFSVIIMMVICSMIQYDRHMPKRPFMVYVCYPTGDIKVKRFTFKTNAIRWLTPELHSSRDIYLYEYHFGHWYCKEEFLGLTDHIIHKGYGMLSEP